MLVETEPTLKSTDEHDLVQLVRALRDAAPKAAIAFVLWPSQAQFLGWQTNAEIAQIRQAAQLHGAQIIELPAIMSHVEQMLPKQGRLRERAVLEVTAAGDPSPALAEPI